MDPEEASRKISEVQMKFATFNEFVINAVIKENADNCYKKKQPAHRAQVDDVLNRKQLSHHMTRNIPN